MINETHDPALRSWLPSANAADTDFPIQNLPFAVFRRRGSNESFRGGVALGDQILDLAAAHASAAFDGEAAIALEHGARSGLNGLMALGPGYWSPLRLALSRRLRDGAALAQRTAAWLVAQAEAEYALPARIGDYTHFCTSIHHARKIGQMLRPGAPLAPNDRWLPIGCHGRVSSLDASGQRFRRPRGQITLPGADEPVFSPSRCLDFELGVGVWIGQGNALGEPITLERSDEHVFGCCLLDAWSARDIEAWEALPLGPFLGRNFATTISPWIVTTEALEPYRMALERSDDDPAPLPYLSGEADRERGAIDLRLEAWLETAKMRQERIGPFRLSQSSLRHSYWSIGQVVAHHTIGGCNLQPGDLLGLGAQSGPASGQAGSLMELSAGGSRPLRLPNGETRGFLADGDAVILRGRCERQGFARIGFGECRGEVLPALAGVA